MSTKVFLIDDHEYILDSVSRLLKQNNIEVLETFKNLDQVLEKYSKQKPDIVIADIRINNEDHGLDFCERLLQEDPEAKVIVLSQFDQASVIERAYTIGVLSYVTKYDSYDELIGAIKQATQGKISITPSVSQILAKRHITGNPVSSLSAREKEVFEHLANGCKQEEIAKKMSISVKMVSNYTQSIKLKLGTDRTAELTKMAIKYGVIGMPC